METSVSAELAGDAKSLFVLTEMASQQNTIDLNYDGDYWPLFFASNTEIKRAV